MPDLSLRVNAVSYTHLDVYKRQVQAFPDGPDFLGIFKAAGFTNTKWIPLTFGIADVYKRQQCAIASYTR